MRPQQGAGWRGVVTMPLCATPQCRQGGAQHHATQHLVEASMHLCFPLFQCVTNVSHSYILTHNIQAWHSGFFCATTPHTQTRMVHSPPPPAPTFTPPPTCLTFVQSTHCTPTQSPQSQHNATHLCHEWVCGCHEQNCLVCGLEGGQLATNDLRGNQRLTSTC